MTHEYERDESNQTAAKGHKSNGMLYACLWLLTCVGILITIIYVLRYANAKQVYSTAGDVYTEIRTLAKPEQLENQDGGLTMIIGGEDSADTGIDWEFIKTVNEDIIAWIYCPDTVIDYPVAQAEDNDYYLHRLPDRTENIVGTVFMDYRNSSIAADKHVVIYGHNMKDGSMFASMTNYKDQSYYDAHPTLTLSTPEGVFKVELFAAYEQDVGSPYDVTLMFESDADFLDYVENARVQSGFKSNAEVGAADRIVTFCLCTESHDYQYRYFVMGKLVNVEAE